MSHRRGDTGAVVLATKIRLENGNDHHIRMEKKKAMTAVRSKRKLLRWKQETGEIRTVKQEIGAIFLASNKK